VTTSPDNTASNHLRFCRLQVTDVYRLLVDDSAAIRHAAGDLVADLLEEQGSRQLAQVRLVWHPSPRLVPAHEALVHADPGCIKRQQPDSPLW